ncbi:MAG: helix-hairpin-helix domain-containing protein, partial [Lachnospiraceae bacterium]|nr:helix-hairpin-helix domain-containing protein [Lachnospiraceae bacterium]
FEPVELEGTTVSRASVHNISIMRGLKLGIGDKITVYKANMIIPQIADNLTESNTIKIPEVCPVCGGKTEIKQVSDVQSLYCINPTCEAKKIKSFTLFVSRDAMNIDGLSEATLEKFIGKGYIHEFADIFHLDAYKDEIIQMEGLGEKSYQNLWESIQKARHTTLAKLIYSLGIANIGLANAKMICREYRNDLDAMRHAEVEELSAIDGVGEIIAGTFRDYFQDEENMEKLNRLLPEIEIAVEEVDEASQTLQGMVFVITGSLEHFENRNAMKEAIEQKGGKVTGSVTSKTVCLINNDALSFSSKNKKARELEIPILTEEEFMQQYLLNK